MISVVENDPKYSSQVVEAQRTTPGPVAVGSRGRIVTSVMSRSVTSTGEVTEFEPNRRYCWRLTSGPVPLSGSMTFSIGDHGTRVDATIEATPRGLLRIAGAHDRSAACASGSGSTPFAIGWLIERVRRR